MTSPQCACRLLPTSLVLALLLILVWACPAPATQDPSQRLAALEKTLALLEDNSVEYRLKESALIQKVADARKAEAKAIADMRVTLAALSVMGDTADLGQAQQALGNLQKLTASLEQALAAWKPEVSQARQSQDQICAQAERVRLGPNLSEAELGRWVQSATKILGTAGIAVRDKRTALNKAWDALIPASAPLEGTVESLKRLLSRRQRYEKAYDRLPSMVAALKQVEIDLAAATKAGQELDALKRARPASEDSLRQELEKLRQRANTGAPGSPEADLKPRIEAALKRLALAALPQSLPSIGDLDPKAVHVLSQASAFDPAAVKASFQRVQSVIASVDPALKQAQSALKQASHAQAGFGGLGKGRDCLAILRNGQNKAPDESLALIEGLQTKLEESERWEHLFTVRYGENKARIPQIRQLQDQAKEMDETYVDVSKGLDQRLGVVKPVEAMQAAEDQMGALNRLVRELEQATGALNQAVQPALQKQQKICSEASKAQAIPRPSDAQMKAWAQSAKSDLSQVRQALNSPLHGARVKGGLAAAQATGLSTAKDTLAALKDEMLVLLNAQTRIRAHLVEARELFSRADEIRETFKSENRELERMRSEALSALKRQQKQVADLAARLGHGGAASVLEALQQRAAAVAQRYDKAPRLAEPDISSPSLTMRYLITSLGESIANHRKNITRSAALITKADASLGIAKAAQQAKDNERSVASTALAEAEKCLTTLQNAASAAGSAVAQARQAVQICDFAQAQNLIAALPSGLDKTQLEADLTAGLNLENDLKALVNQAGSAYKACEYAQALTLIQQARQRAKCPRHISSLDDKKAKIQAAQSLENELRALVDKARAKYKDCRLDEALTILDQAQGKAKCGKHRQSINKKISLAKKKREHEKITLDLFGKAKKLYANGEYADAKALLIRAQLHTTCQRYRDSLDDKIAKVNQKLGAGQVVPPPPSDEDNNQHQQTTCVGFVDQLKAQRAEVLRLAQHYESIRRNNPNNPREVLGPNACRVVGASDLFGRIKQQALDAGCPEVNLINDPAAGTGATVVRLDCQRWKQGNGDGRRQTNCQPFKNRKSQAAAEQNRLIQKYQQMERKRLSAAQKRSTACAVLQKGKEISRIMKEALNNGCNVGGHSVWLPPTLKTTCGQGTQSRDNSSVCNRYQNEVNRLVEAVSADIGRMASLSQSRHTSQAALENLACAMVVKIEQLKQTMSKAQRTGCPVRSQVGAEQMARIYRLCPGR
jgi:hypothetical protein